MKRSLVLFALLSFVASLLFSGSNSFNESISSTGTGLNIGGGLFPISLSWIKSRNIQILDEDEYGKANLQFSFSSTLSNSSDYGFDKKTGKPSWVEGGISSPGNWNEYYFNPTANMSLSLSQKFEKWTVFGGFYTRYSQPMENLGISSRGNVYSGSFYFQNPDGSLKFGNKEEIAAYPWLYGERHNFTTWLSFTLSRSYEVDGLDSMNVSMGVEMGPWWMLNSISNGNRLSSYYRISGSATESVRIKDTRQSINLRWLNITASHSNSFSYTFGSVVPQNKINSYRLRGTLSDTLSISFAGPQLYDSSTSVSASFAFNNYLYFGSVENMSEKTYGLAFDSYVSVSGYLNFFGIVTFSLSGNRYLVRGFDGPSRWSTSGEVAMRFNF